MSNNLTYRLKGHILDQDSGAGIPGLLVNGQVQGESFTDEDIPS